MLRHSWACMARERLIAAVRPTWLSRTWAGKVSNAQDLPPAQAEGQSESGDMAGMKGTTTARRPYQVIIAGDVRPDAKSDRHRDGAKYDRMSSSGTGSRSTITRLTLAREDAVLVEHIGDAARHAAPKLRPIGPKRTTTTPPVMYSQRGHTPSTTAWRSLRTAKRSPARPRRHSPSTARTSATQR